MPRGAKTGERRGGRQIGTPNKKTQAVADTLAELGCNPIKGMAKIAMDESQPMQLRATMYRELAQYIAPKRKAVEVTGEDGSPIKGELTIDAWLDSINGKSLGPPSERPGFEESVRRYEEIRGRR
jgi:hypothetical protein